jgi:hypothetical protein
MNGGVAVNMEGPATDKEGPTVGDFDKKRTKR